jgi:SET domain-containing protein
MREAYEAGLQERQGTYKRLPAAAIVSNDLQCYYLMSFDNKMIIDATRGTIARFVNHSCEPNCEMIKWTVGGEPRMALFAGSRGIMTGEELTYDYNFE